MAGGASMNGNSSIGPSFSDSQPEQHAREPGAQDLGLGELRSLGEILLGIKAHADAGREPAAAARALHRVRARDRLDT